MYSRHRPIGRRTQPVRARPKRRLLLAAAAALILPATLCAANKTYVGPNGGDWNTSSFWSPAGVPAPGDFAVFQPPGSGSYSFDASYSSASPLGTLTLGDAVGVSTPTLNQTAGTLNAYFENFNNSTFDQSGGLNNIQAQIEIGAATNSSGNYNLTGGTFSSGADVQLAVGGYGSGTLAQSGTLSTSNIGGYVDVGSSGPGTLSLSGGSMTIFETYIGAGGNGTFLQSSGSSSLSVVDVGNTTTGFASLTGGTFVSSQTYVGDRGSGTFVQQGTLSVSNFTTSLVIGDQAQGFVSLMAGSMTSAATNVGQGASATFTQTGGSSNLGNLNVAGGANGSVSLGSGTMLATNVALGLGATGTFSQSGGVSNITGQLLVGDNSEFAGDASLTAGSMTASQTMVGFGGIGTFTQNGSLSFSNLGTLIIASATTSFGTVSLSAGSMTAANTMIGVAGSGTFGQSGGSSSLGAVQVKSFGAILLSGGTMDVQSISSAGSITINGGTLAITGAGSLGSGSVASTGFSISGPGVLDVGSSGLVIEYGSGTSPVGDLSYARTARNYPANSIQRYAQTGFDALNWDGPGINSSYAANDSSGLTAVGVADENDLDNVYPADYTRAGGGTGTWMGQPINDTNNVLVRLTYYGDGNLDGVVNKFDVAALAEGYSGLAGYIGWSDGDYIYAGYISKLDISLLAESYVFQGAPLGDGITAGQAQYLLALDPDMAANVRADFQSIAGTPEPGSVALLGTATIGLLARRRTFHKTGL